MDTKMTSHRKKKEWSRWLKSSNWSYLLLGAFKVTLNNSEPLESLIARDGNLGHRHAMSEGVGTYFSQMNDFGNMCQYMKG